MISVLRILQDEVKNLKRQLSKYKMRNEVLKGQSRKIETEIRQRLAISEERGVIDIDQLQLENRRYIEDSQTRNRQLIDHRRMVASARKRKEKVKRFFYKIVTIFISIFFRSINVLNNDALRFVMLVL